MDLKQERITVKLKWELYPTSREIKRETTQTANFKLATLLICTIVRRMRM